MGRRTLVPFIEDLRGKFSKIVFSSNLAGPYFRKYVIPTNPKTSAQKDMRKIITDASRDWQSLTQNQILFWKNYLSTLKQWYIGTSENLSAFNGFISVTTQIKTLIESANHSTIVNSEDWDKEVPTYTPTVEPAGKPPIALLNVGGSASDVYIKVENGITVASITINLYDNKMAQGDYLKTTDNRKASFVLWLSNPGKYPTSNMKPMVQKVLSTGLLKIKKDGSQVSSIQAKVNIPVNYYRLVPQLGQYVTYTLAIQTEDGPYAILKTGTKQVVPA